MPRYLISNFLGIVGAVIGGVLGFYTFRWLVGQNLYGLMIPGAFVGLGCSLLAQHPSRIRGVVCGLGALGLGLFTEWWFWPFKADDSLWYFLKNAGTLKPVTLLMIGVGAIIAFWVGADAGFRGLSAQRAYVHKGPDAEASKLE